MGTLLNLFEKMLDDGKNIERLKKVVESLKGNKEYSDDTEKWLNKLEKEKYTKLINWRNYVKFVSLIVHID